MADPSTTIVNSQSASPTEITVTNPNLVSSTTGANSPTLVANTQIYQAVIACLDQKISVSLYLPETVRVGAQAHYNQPFAPKGDIGILTGAAQLLGIQPLTQFLTSQLWSGSTVFDMEMDFFVYADSNVANIQVVQPYRDLMKLMLPSEVAGFAGLLQSPGPVLAPRQGTSWSDALNSTITATGTAASTVGGTLNSLMQGGDAGNALTATKGAVSTLTTDLSNIFTIKNQVSIQIGTYLIFPSVVLTHVSGQFTNLLDASGKPNIAQITVGFRTFQTPLVQATTPGNNNTLATMLGADVGNSSLTNLVSGLIGTNNDAGITPASNVA